ncbi:homocysteine S-methyltransferase family protein [Candidatus Sumerlaeota bacterium]|nr:homocysteine S-methyltransferase family protein [Candidatus Sumerlaeota bacterium]
MKLAELIATATTPILIDGAMGTQLALAGLDMGGQNCIQHPDEVLAVHKRYCEAGCDLLITNTLTMNRIYLETHNVNIDVKEVNLAGARIAKNAAGEGRYVLGDISSTGQLLEPYGEYTEDQCCETFKEQAEFLLAGGVDGFIVETMLDLREALCAVRACRDVADVPVLASLSFNTTANGGRTIMGNTAREIAVAMADAGAAAVGANCGDLDPRETAVIVSFMKQAVSIPIMAQPNAGKPRLADGHTVFDLTPEDFAAGIQECITAGASLVGGCCGTSPDHIRCIAKAIGKI